MNSGKSESPVGAGSVKKQKPARPAGTEPRRRTGTDRRDIEGLVEEPGPGDGVDPRLEAKRRRRAAEDCRHGLAHGIHQQERFAGQVQVAIDAALQSAVTPILNALTVLEVVKQGGSILVVVGPRNPADALDLKAAGRALERASSMLSREVASAITRKDAPNLSFVLLPAGSERIDQGADERPR